MVDRFFDTDLSKTTQSEGDKFLIEYANCAHVDGVIRTENEGDIYYSFLDKPSDVSSSIRLSRYSPRKGIVVLDVTCSPFIDQVKNLLSIMAKYEDADTLDEKEWTRRHRHHFVIALLRQLTCGTITITARSNEDFIKVIKE